MMNSQMIFKLFTIPFVPVVTIYDSSLLNYTSINRLSSLIDTIFQQLSRSQITQLPSVAQLTHLLPFSFTFLAVNLPLLCYFLLKIKHLCLFPNTPHSNIAIISPANYLSTITCSINCRNTTFMCLIYHVIELARLW